eukprot:7085235-Alexandrium_andersonii.AAC.1
MIVAPKRNWRCPGSRGTRANSRRPTTCGPLRPRATRASSGARAGARASGCLARLSLLSGDSGGSARCRAL